VARPKNKLMNPKPWRLKFKFRLLLTEKFMHE